MHFLRGEKEFGRLLSSHWIKVLFPLQWLITTTENEKERGREREIEMQRSWKKAAYAYDGWLTAHPCIIFPLPKPTLNIAQ